MRRGSLLVVIGVGCFAALLMPAISAAWGGDEDAPAVTDAAGDVTYHEAYPGQRGHDYLDILKASWDYDPSADKIALTLQGLDYTAFSDPPPADFTITCYARATLSLQSSITGDLIVGFRNPRGASGFTPFANFSKSGPGGEIPLAFEFKGTFGAPGLLEFGLPRQLLLNYGDEAKDLSVRCGEEYFPGQYPSNPVVQSSLIRNYDVADGNGSVNFTALVPAGRVDTEPDPFASASDDRTAQTTRPQKGSPGLAMASSMVAAALATWWYRRPR